MNLIITTLSEKEPDVKRVNNHGLVYVKFKKTGKLLALEGEIVATFPEVLTEAGRGETLCLDPIMIMWAPRLEKLMELHCSDACMFAVSESYLVYKKSRGGEIWGLNKDFSFSVVATMTCTLSESLCVPLKNLLLSVLPNRKLTF